MPARAAGMSAPQRGADDARAQTEPLRFTARLLRPAKPGPDGAWAFLVLPQDVSAQLPRRGRTTVEGRLNSCPFQATLEPDGRLSHWLKVHEALSEAAHAEIGAMVAVQLAPVLPEPEPALPEDLRQALMASPPAQAVWEGTTTVARLDWIHWIDAAKQAKTRQTRVRNACAMLADGHKRVCCFDVSGYYSKGLSAPPAAD